MLRAILYLLVVFSSVSAWAGGPAPLDELRQFDPHLYQLHQSYPSYHKGLEQYAQMQGFQQPVEKLATVVHELIHIDSARHQGFYIAGIYYEPSLAPENWPRLTNRDMEPFWLPAEQGRIYWFYARNTPKNNLGNLVDEINAYGHVAEFVCRYEPTSAQKQVDNLLGLLRLSDGYLRRLRTAMPEEYRRFTGNREARGAFSLVVQRAWAALVACAVPEASWAFAETAYLLARR